MIYFISLTNECNMSCGYCPMKKWRNQGLPETISAELILSYMDKYWKPGDSVELTGGEPGKVAWLDELLDGLEQRSIPTVIKSNGSFNIKKHSNVIRCYAWHTSYPENECEYIIIIKHLNYAEKVKVCSEKGQPFKIIEFGKEIKEKCGNPGLRFIAPDGNIGACYGVPDVKGEFKIERLDWNPIEQHCQKCKSIHDHIIFLGQT